MPRRRFSVAESNSSVSNRARLRWRSRSLDAAFGSETGLSRIRQSLHRHAEAFLGTNDHYRNEGINLLLFPFVSNILNNRDFPITVLEDWLVEPLLVTNLQLAGILRLEECTRASPVPLTCKQGHITYFRSWELSKHQFGQIIDALGQDGADIQDWRFALRRCREDGTVTVRYVGTTQSPATPWKRAMQKNERKGSTIGAFSTCLRKYAPAVAIPKVFAIVGSFVPTVSSRTLGSKGLRGLADCYERAFISFFKPRTLLNRQPGGKTAAHGMDADVEMLFASCQTALLSQLENHISTQSDTMSKAVATCFDDWFKYARDNIWGLNNPGPSSAYINSTYSQAQPRQINGTSVAVICGQDPPLESLDDGAPFFSGARATSSFVVSTLSSMLFEAGIARIVELPLNPLLPCIVIPHIHPGYLVRTEMSPDLWRVALLTWVASWVHMHAAVHILQTSLGAGSRRALCEAIVERATRTLQKTGFYDLLLNAANLASVVKNPIRVVDSTPLGQDLDYNAMNLDLEKVTTSLKRKRLLEWHLSTTQATKITQGCLEVLEDPMENIRPLKKVLLIREGHEQLSQKHISKYLHELHAAIEELMAKQTEWLQRQSLKGPSHKLPLIPMAQLDGSKVNINQKGDMRLRVWSADGHEHLIATYIGHLAAPVHPDDFRTIHFTPHGVDLRNPQGISLCPRTNDLRDDIAVAPTFPISRLKRLEGGKELSLIWKQIRGIEPLQSDAPKGNPIPKRAPENLESIRPLALNDALWLLDQYLDEYFPDGGEIWLGEKRYFPKGTDDVDRFTSHRLTSRIRMLKNG
ncbi:hypothetical protein SPI_05298 [Niveomyces insectorum RCEF 264]|uniref:Uncharacterized protein n=1 Tax=Niveomyces insectorum RCEF 264 TaxID=1081102 RepID=A0A167U609_9HYPO|nr:hypothetical protein SPI_05298 [Niveomyces insectorum RCEF 264]